MITQLCAAHMFGEAQLAMYTAISTNLAGILPTLKVQNT